MITPTIARFPEQIVVGMACEFSSDGSADASEQVHALIGGLWQEFMPRSSAIGRRAAEHALGVMRPLGADANGVPNRFHYLAAVPVHGVDELPDGMEQATISAGAYAFFPFRGVVQPQKVSALMGYMYGIWLPQSGHGLREGPHLEWYDHRFIPGSEDSICEMGMPIAA